MTAQRKTFCQNDIVGRNAVFRCRDFRESGFACRAWANKPRNGFEGRAEQVRINRPEPQQLDAVNVCTRLGRRETGALVTFLSVAWTSPIVPDALMGPACALRVV